MFAGSTTLSRLELWHGGSKRHGQEDQSRDSTCQRGARARDVVPLDTRRTEQFTPPRGADTRSLYSPRQEQMPESASERSLTSKSDRRVRGCGTECPALPTMKSSARCARWSVPLLSPFPRVYGPSDTCHSPSITGSLYEVLAEEEMTLMILLPVLCSQTAFIKQEALEKAREIKVKADEEFAIEKVCGVVLFPLWSRLLWSTAGSPSDAAG